MTTQLRVPMGCGKACATRSKDQADQNTRVDWIEEGRTVDLQRLATVEEGLEGQEILRDVRSKLDRALESDRAS